MKHSPKTHSLSQGSLTARVWAYAFFSIVTVICVVPIILLVIASFTKSSVLSKYGYSFFPKEWSLEAYEFLFTQGSTIMHSFMVSVVLTVVGTFLGLLLTSMLAYVLSRPEVPGRRGMMFFVFFTLLFNGGMVPTYFMYVNYFHFKNSYLGLLVPYLLVNGFNVMLVRTFFSNNVSSSLIESARIDGAGEWRVFFQIVLPITTPILVTVGLLIGTSYWNDWYNGMLFATKVNYFSLQNFLYQIMMDLKFLSTNANVTADVSSIMARIPSNSVRMAMAFLGTVPILIVFPFVQKYFARGLSLGSVKE